MVKITFCLIVKCAMYLLLCIVQFTMYFTSTVSVRRAGNGHASHIAKENHCNKVTELVFNERGLLVLPFISLLYKYETKLRWLIVTRFL